MERKLLDARGVASMLGVSLRWVYVMAKAGRLPVGRVGRLVRFSPAALQRWIERGGAPLPGGWRRELPK